MPHHSSVYVQFICDEPVNTFRFYQLRHTARVSCPLITFFLHWFVYQLICTRECSEEWHRTTYTKLICKIKCAVRDDFHIRATIDASTRQCYQRSSLNSRRNESNYVNDHTSYWTIARCVMRCIYIVNASIFVYIRVYINGKLNRFTVVSITKMCLCVRAMLTAFSTVNILFFKIQY